MSELADRLRGIVGNAHVLPGEPRYERDVTGRFGGPAAAVVRPGSGAEVAAVLATCAATGTGVVPQGGNTGLVGGGVPRNGEVVVNLRRLETLEDVDFAAGQVTAGAGSTIAALQRHAAGAGLAYGVDLASRDSAT